MNIRECKKGCAVIKDENPRCLLCEMQDFISELAYEVEKLPAGEQQTKVVCMITGAGVIKQESLKGLLDKLYEDRDNKTREGSDDQES
jgi:hypothetical protein